MKNAGNTGTDKTPRMKWHERTADRDIRYRGPLNYQHFQILGWLCVVALQLSLILNLALSLDMLSPDLEWLLMPSHSLGMLSLPFLLVENFAQIMNGQKSYKSLLIKNFGLAAGLWLGYSILLTRYVCGLIGIVNNGTHSNMDVLEAAVTRLVSSGVISFNIFIDLFLCTLVMFFMNYMPKKIFTGKKD